jgi:hypothetical protein
VEAPPTSSSGARAEPSPVIIVPDRMPVLLRKLREPIKAATDSGSARDVVDQIVTETAGPNG